MTKLENLKTNFKNIFKDPHFYIAIIVVFAIVIIGFMIRKSLNTKMEVVFFKIGKTEFDIWSLSHLILYMYFGYFFPEYFLEFLIIGTGWELFEGSFCRKLFLEMINCDTSNLPKVGKKYKDSDNALCKIIKKADNCDYWYGKWQDIPTNMAGFLVGMLLSRLRK